MLPVFSFMLHPGIHSSSFQSFRSCMLPGFHSCCIQSSHAVKLHSGFSLRLLPVFSFMLHPGYSFMLHPGFPFKLHQGFSFMLHPGYSFMLHPGFPFKLHRRFSFMLHPGFPLMRPPEVFIQTISRVSTSARQKLLFMQTSGFSFLEIQSVMLVFSTQLCELLPPLLPSLWFNSPPSPLPRVEVQCVAGRGRRGVWVVLETTFCMSFDTLCLTRIKPTKLQDRAQTKTLGGGGGGGLRRIKSYCKFPMQVNFFEMTTFCFGVLIVNRSMLKIQDWATLVVGPQFIGVKFHMNRWKSTY